MSKFRGNSRSQSKAQKRGAELKILGIGVSAQGGRESERDRAN